jgi:hypothetical protein
MSRIHEALKKAAEERSLRLASGSEQDFVGTATDVIRTTFPSEAAAIPQVPNFPPKGDLAFLNFEEIAKKCAHPKWQPDSSVNVFQGAGTDKIGAERFRTLRSRLYQIAGTHKLKNFCCGEFGAVHCAPKRPPRPSDRCRSQELALAPGARRSRHARPDRLFARRSK